MKTSKLKSSQVAAAIALGAALIGSACGVGPQGAPDSETTVYGRVGSGSEVALLVSLKDSAQPPAVSQTTPDATGFFLIDVSGLQGPFLVKGEVAVGGATVEQFATVKRGGEVEVNSTSTREYENEHPGSTDGGQGEADDGQDSHGFTNHRRFFELLKVVLAPLFQEFGVTFPLTTADTGPLRAMLAKVKFSVSGGVLTVTNRATSGVIFSGPITNLASGTFTPSNLPLPPANHSCTYSYSAWGTCTNGHQSRTETASTPAGCTGTPVLTQSCTPPPPGACTYTYSAWGTCTNGNQSRTVTASTPAGCTGTPVLTQACTPPPPPACTYTYSAWGMCTNGNQSRTVTASTPAGCTGTPVLTQTCINPPPPNPVTFAGTVTACTSCHGLTSNTTVFQAGGYTVKSRSAAGWLSTVNNMVKIGSSLPPGATAQNLADYLAGVP